MKVKKIRAEGFRNIESCEVEFCDGVNILVGKNGQGKTNIAEAIYLCSVGRSFRGADEGDMIGFGKDISLVEVGFEDCIREQSIRFTMFRDKGKRRQIERNKVKISRLSDMVGSLSCVLFCPEHLSLIKDGPAARRSYLDIAISQLRPVYMSALQRYTKILKQRNKLIRDAEDDRRTFDETIDFWSEQLASEAAVIADMRARYIIRANGIVKDFFADMTDGKEVPHIEYAGSSHREQEFYLDREQVRDHYIKLLRDSHDREICAGTTLYGIHKDDVRVELNGHPARIFASQGQQRSLSLALKLAEGEISRRERGEYPVLLLDDVLSELDERRRSYLINEIEGKQVIMTSCERADVGDDARIITVNAGKYEVLN